jgi:hypothetical protein
VPQSGQIAVDVPDCNGTLCSAQQVFAEGSTSDRISGMNATSTLTRPTFTFTFEPRGIAFALLAAAFLSVTVLLLSARSAGYRDPKILNDPCHTTTTNTGSPGFVASCTCCPSLAGCVHSTLFSSTCR